MYKTQLLATVVSSPLLDMMRITSAQVAGPRHLSYFSLVKEKHLKLNLLAGKKIGTRVSLSTLFSFINKALCIRHIRMSLSAQHRAALDKFCRGTGFEDLLTIGESAAN